MTTDQKRLLIAAPIVAVFSGLALAGWLRAEKMAMKDRIEAAAAQSSADMADLNRKMAEKRKASEEAQANAGPVTPPERIKPIEEELAAMTPEQRMKEMKMVCMRKACDSTGARRIIAAAPTDAEKKSLDAVFTKNYALAAMDSREAYASGLDTALLQRHMNPDTVEARGPSKTTLYLKGGFCSRQAVYDMQNSSVGKDARILGFTGIQCEGIGSTATGEL
jgi:hypothetical protein